MADLDLAELRRLSAEAQLPWHLHPENRPNILGTFTVFYGHGETSFNQVCGAYEAKARYLTAAANAIPGLVGEIERLRAERIRFKRLSDAVAEYATHTDDCEGPGGLCSCELTLALTALKLHRNLT